MSRFFILLLLNGITVASAAATEPFFRRSEDDSRPRVVQPGGCTRQAPANTARPISLAMEDGIDAVELVVRRSKEGTHVVFDTERVDDRTSGTGPVKDLTLAELQALDAGSWFAKRFADAKIMSLAQVLEMAGDRIGLVLDCQDVDAAKLAGEIAAAGKEGQVLLTGKPKLLDAIRASSGDKIATLARLPAGADVTAWLRTATAATRPGAVLLPAAAATPENCRLLHEQKITVLADACGEQDGPETWDRLIAAGVDLVRTAVPEEFLVHAISRPLPDRKVQIAAHRGALRYAPENTPASLDKAVRMHNDFVEIDVQTTSDGQFFLLHDATLDRTTDGHGRVRQNAADTLRGLDAGRWFGLPFASMRVPELNEYLSQYPPQLGLYFDAKDITPEALAEAVARHGLVERTVVYQGPVYLEKLKQINPRIRLLSPIASASHVDTLAKRFAPYAVDTPWKLLSAEYIAHCHELGIKVFSDAKGDATVEDYRRVIDWGIDLVQTDHPLRFWRALELSAASK